MDTNRTATPKRTRLAALIAGGLLLGGVAAGVAGASAATAESGSTGSTASSTSSTSSTNGMHGASGETIVSGTKAATLKAAAVKAVPGATVDRVETDSGDAAYEVHLTKSDGSHVTVKFDSSLARTAVEDGMGKGPGRSTAPQSGSGTEG